MTTAWRASGRGTALRVAGMALLLAVPAVAMQVSDEVRWTVGDFVAAALLLLAFDLPYELTVRTVESRPLRLGIAAACALGLVLAWGVLATG